MVEKYKVTQGFMEKLEEWRKNNRLDATNTDDKYSFLSYVDLRSLPKEVSDWWVETTNPIERNKRLIAIINWLDGEKVFEVEKPHKFVIRSTKMDGYGGYRWMNLQRSSYGLEIPNYAAVEVFWATKFETRMDAELWNTNGYEVVEVDGDGKEVTK